jgi:hypothetical protein
MVLRVLAVVAFLVLLVLASGCTNKPSGGANETTEYEYYNDTGANGTGTNGTYGNESAIPVVAENGFSFKIHGINEFWLKGNDTTKFYVVFNNRDEDASNHSFIARAFPSAADFDVMAAFECLHFTTCDGLLSRMRSMIDQPENQTLAIPGRVGLYAIGIRIPDGTPTGTYMYNLVACKEIPFADCTETSTNFGANIPVIVHVE